MCVCVCVCVCVCERERERRLRSQSLDISSKILEYIIKITEKLDNPEQLYIQCTRMYCMHQMMCVRIIRTITFP